MPSSSEVSQSVFMQASGVDGDGGISGEVGYSGNKSQQRQEQCYLYGNPWNERHPGASSVEDRSFLWMFQYHFPPFSFPPPPPPLPPPLPPSLPPPPPPPPVFSPLYDPSNSPNNYSSFKCIDGNNSHTNVMEGTVSGKANVENEGENDGRSSSSSAPANPWCQKAESCSVMPGEEPSERDSPFRSWGSTEQYSFFGSCRPHGQEIQRRSLFDGFVKHCRQSYPSVTRENRAGDLRGSNSYGHEQGFYSRKRNFHNRGDGGYAQHKYYYNHFSIKQYKGRREPYVGDWSYFNKRKRYVSPRNGISLPSYQNWHTYATTPPVRKPQKFKPKPEPYRGPKFKNEIWEYSTYRGGYNRHYHHNHQSRQPLSHELPSVASDISAAGDHHDRAIESVQNVTGGAFDYEDEGSYYARPWGRPCTQYSTTFRCTNERVPRWTSEYGAHNQRRIDRSNNWLGAACTSNFGGEADLVYRSNSAIRDDVSVGTSGPTNWGGKSSPASGDMEECVQSVVVKEETEESGEEEEDTTEALIGTDDALCIEDNNNMCRGRGVITNPRNYSTVARHGRVQSVKFLSDDSSTAVSAISGGNGGVRTGKSATVAFIDIRSAAKAFRSVHSMAGQPLQISYHEPGSVPPRIIPNAEHSSPGDSIAATAANETGTNSVSSLPTGSTSSVSGPGITNGPNPPVSGPGLFRQQRFPVQHGQSEDSSSHFYDQPKGFSRGRGDGHGFHGTRGRREHRHPYHNNRHSFPGDRNYRMSWGYPNEGRFAPPAHSEVDERTSGPPPPTHPPQNDIGSKGNRRPDSPASSVSSRHLPSKRHKSRSMSESGSSDRGSSGGSRSRSGSRSSVSTSVSSGRSRSPPHHSSSGHYSNSRGGSPGGRFHQNSYSRHRYSRSRLVSRPADSSRVRHSSRSPPMAASPSSSASSSPSPHRKINAAPHSPSHSPSSAKSYSPSRSLSTSGHHHHHHRRTPNTAELQSAIRIRNLPIRSSDTSLKDGLYHEYKKHGKVSWVRVIGTGSDRFAIVCFKSSEHATRAVALSQDKQFFGCKIQVSAYYSSRGDEPLGGTDEDNRGLGDDEPSSVSYPTRTVLITGLDATVTQTELRTAFDQYGDIVTIDIRKQGVSTHAVCEFVDIASAIRAQWGRHMFKSREARISFYRASPTSSLLLDGTDGVNEKQITGHCSQYGAITRVVMDTDRILALVQFDEISSAQTAIRELRNWIIKGKTLHVDFASPDCIRMFMERIACRGAVRGDNSSPSLRLSTTPPLSNSMGGISLKEGRRLNRRFTECPDERKSPYSIYRHTTDVEYEGAKPMTQIRMLDESASPESAFNLPLRQGDIGNTGIMYGDENMVVGGMGCRRRTGYTSPVSPDPDHLNMSMDEDSSSDIKGSGKSDHCKIDLSCHETDSAVVTSSSDVIIAEKDTHANHHDSSTVNGDGKHVSYDFVRISCNSNVKKSHAAVTVDSVSSTSPEPKTETVRKASPDPGIGYVEPTPRIIGDPHVITSGLADPRKKPSESKVRRSSADSGSNSTPSTMFAQHSSNGGSSASATSNYSSSSVDHCNHIASEGGGDESDDRPGTPLCDENPESFGSTESVSAAVLTKTPSRTVSQSSKNDQPLSLPLPGFALQQRFSHYNNNNNSTSSNHAVSRHNSVSALSSRDSMMMMRLSRSSSDTAVLKSPIKSPAYDGGASVMNSSASECDIFSPSSHSETKTVNSDRLSNTRPVLSFSNASTNIISNSSNTGNSNNYTDSYENSPETSGNLRSSGDSEENSSRGLSVKSSEEVSVLADVCDSPRSNTPEDEAPQGDSVTLDSSLPEDQQAGVASSSDSESGSSPRRSPTGTSLEQRIQKFYERYDQWNGIRTTVRSTVPLHQGAMATLDNLGRPGAATTAVSPGIEANETAPSPVSRFARTKHKVLDLDELRHQPSDIVKSLLAKKSVFDEDTKRLENFGEKYEAKPVSIAGGNWRLALNRSSSTASTSSTASNSSLATPMTPTTPVATSASSFPSPSTPTCSSSGIARTSTSQTGAHVHPVGSPASKPHHPVNHFPSGPSGSAKSGTKDLSSSVSNSSGHWSTSAGSSGHGKSLPTPGKSLPSPTGTSSKSTNSAFPPLSNVKPQTEVPSKLQAASIPTLPSPSNKHESANPASTTSPTAASSSVGSSSSSRPGKSPLLNSALPATPGPQAGVHVGIPRMVERSVSLDSKRSLTQVPATYASSSAGCSPNSASSNASPSLTSSSSTPTERSSGRRISVDHPSAVKEVQLPRSKSTSNEAESTKVSKESPAPLTKERIAKVVQAKDDLSNKSMSLIKGEGPLMHQHGHSQETTVAVVATVQTPMIAPKDAKKDSREKKRRSSGASTPVQSNPNPPNDKPEGSTSAASSKPSSSSSKESKDRKDKELKKSSSSDDTTTTTSNPQSQHSSSGNHHHGKTKSSSSGSGSTSSKEKTKEERDHGESNPSAASSASKESSHAHRKDKEKEINKMKRRLSSQDSESASAEPKKPKIEKKDGHSKESSSTTEQSHNSHRSKHNSTTERRESRDSSSNAKERPNKEKSENKDRENIKSEGSASGGSSLCKDKDQHHRSKTSSSSSSGSSSKHHHHGEKEKSKSSSTDPHSTSYSHKSNNESSKKKDKVSPCKESSGSGKSKHSSSSSHHGSHHSSGSTSSKKDGSSGKSRSSSSKDKDGRVKEKHGSITADTDDDTTTSTVVAANTAPPATEKEKDRDKNKDRESKHEKRDSSSKRDRHKSGGESSSFAGGEKKKEQKKKRRYVVDDSDSSDSGKSDDDEEENKKHHSIFEVIVDEYVSMYDKVKARSNRACKNQPTPQQQKEEERKQQKLKEQFQQLKQSRAKREEKKRSTSIEERKSFVNSSSDESHPGQHNDSDAGERDQPKLDQDRDRRDSVRDVVAEQSSDDEVHHNHKPKSSSSRSHQKSKNRSSKGKTKQKGRKSNKTTPSGTTFPSSSSIFFSHSDEDSHASSPPVTKKRKLKHQFTAISTASSMSHQSLDTKSSDDTMSDYDDSNVIISNVKGSSSKTKFVNSAPRSTKKLRTADIYSDSDSSVRSNRTSKNVAATPNKGKSSRDKAVKQKSMDIKKLFDDSSDSSGGEEAVKKEKEVKDEFGKNRSKDKEKENKSSSGSSKKKHHSVSSSKSSSNKGSRRQRVSSGDTASCDTAIHAAVMKRDSSSNMKDMLFGSMTPSSSSDVDEKPTFDERPKTPTPLLIPPSGSKIYEDTPVSSKSKSKTSRSKQRKSSSSLVQAHSSHGSHSSVEDVSMDSSLVTPPVTSSSGKTSSSEKKKRRHHRDRRSRRTDSQDTNISSSVHSTTPTSFDQIKVKSESVDLDSLFNSPAPSPKLVIPKTEPVTPALDNPILKVDIPPPNLFGPATSQMSPMLDSLKALKEKEKSAVDMDDCVSNMKSMFSTDEDDDDDDNKLKIDINEAIMASDDQHDDIENDEIKEDDSEQKRRAEEEEKKLHCLFEQDKAIESIVNDRKTPPIVVSEEEVNPKDEIPKDETAISQEETEDAVAALLETLEGDDTINEDGETGVKSASPPTLRIIEEGPPSGEVEPESLPPPVDIPIPEEEKGQSWYDTKSPKELLIDEGAAPITDSVQTPAVMDDQADAVRRSSVDSTGINCPPRTPDIRCSDDEQRTTKQSEEEFSKPSTRAGSRKSSRNDSSDAAVNDDNFMQTSSADVYEFHDSDDEGRNATKPLAHAKPVVAPPVKSPCLTVKVEEPQEPTVAKAATSTPSPAHTPVVIPKVEPPVHHSPVATHVAPASLSPATATPTIQAPLPPKPVTPSVIKGEPSPLPKPATPLGVSGGFGTGNRTPPVIQPPVRTTVDDTIDDVIRMVQTDAFIDSTLTPVPPKPVTARARSRSKSKDATEDTTNVSTSFVVTPNSTSVTGAISKIMVTKPAEGSPRRSNSNTPAPPVPATVLTSGPHSVTELSHPLMKSEKEDTSGMETLIDPKTGLMIPMMRQSDEYIPVMTQSQDSQPTHHLHQHHLQISQSRTAEIISKAMERPSVLEKLPPQPQQHPSALSKPEGLPAVLAQQQLHQQQQQQLLQQQKQLLLQHFQQQQPQHMQQQLPQTQQQHQQQGQQMHPQQSHHAQQQSQQHQQQQQQHQQQQGQPQHHQPPQLPQMMQTVQQSHSVPKSMVITHTSLPSKTAVIYTSGPGFLPNKPGGYPQGSAQPSPMVVPSSSPSVSAPYKPGAQQSMPAISKANFTQIPHSQPSQNVAYHQVTVVRPNDQMQGQPPPRPTLPTANLRAPHNIQAQLVRLPQVPSALTITKINTSEEQERKSTIIQHPNVILTASSAPPVSSVGMSGSSIVRAVVPPAHPLQHVQQPVQIHQAELIRMGRLMGKEDASQHLNRSQDSFGPTARAEGGGGVVVTASPSPKAGRVPQQHEQTPPPPSQQRVMAQHHPMTYDPQGGDVRVLPHVRQSTESAHYMASQQAHQQVVYSTHYVPASVAGSIVSVAGQQSPFGMRVTPGDKIVQQDKRGTPELHKGGATLTLINPERGVPQAAHHISPHLASPHAAEGRSSESPLVATVYATQRQVYGAPVPAHQPAPSHLHRQTFSNPYADLEDGRYSNSPSYHHQYDPRPVIEREREPPRIPSPYTSVAMVSRRALSPPPAHSARYGIHPVADTPTPADRQRPPPSQTPPHGSQVPAQREDSLLMLLQRYPIMWQGLLSLKNDNAACQMHFVSGNLNVARESLPTQPDGTIPPLRISQRMRLEQTQLEGVARKMQIESEHCMLLALPCGRDHMDVLQQSNNLRNGFITYLQLKQAAGIVNIHHPITQQPAYVIHIFPSCDFANENLARIAPDLLHGVADIAHLLIVIATV